MQNVTIDTAKTLVGSNTVTRAVIECFDGRRWCIVLRGRDEYLVRSARQCPKAFARVETALEEIRGLGLRQAEVDFKKWTPGQNTLA